MTLQSTTCLTVMSCVTSGMRWTVNWRTATVHHAFLNHLESVVDNSVSTVILHRDGCWHFLKRGTRGWRLTLYTCNWRQTQGTPDVLASREHWCNNCRKKRSSLWSQTSGPPFLQRLPQAELFKQHSPRQQCWRSSSCGPTVSEIPPGWFGELQYQLHWPVATPPQRRRKNKADDNTITKIYRAPMRITSTKWQHLQQLKKILPQDYHHFYDALPHGDWILRQFWFQGRHPWTSKEHAQQSKD